MNFKKLSPEAIAPTRATPGSAGIDFYSPKDVWIANGATVLISTQIAVEIPPGHVGLFCSRSGLAAKQQIFVLNSPGIIDEDYRGELIAILTNVGEFGYCIKKGDRVAQLLIVPVNYVTLDEVKELGSTERNTGGLGSTGK